MNDANTKPDSNPDPAGIKICLKRFKGNLGRWLRNDYHRWVERHERDLAVEPGLYDEEFWSRVVEFVVDNDLDPQRYFGLSLHTLSDPAWPSALLSPTLAMRYHRRQADTASYYLAPKENPRRLLELFDAYVARPPNDPREVLGRGGFGKLFHWCIALRGGLDDVERGARGHALHRLLDPEIRRSYGEVFQAEISGWAAKHCPG